MLRSGLRRIVAVAVAAVTVLAGAACGGDDSGGAPTINLYYAPEQNLDKVIANCNAQAAGRYEIVHRVLPRAADDQRVQMVRRLAAADRDMDVLGLDVTWTQEFASAEWIREWTGQHKAEASQDLLPGPKETATYEGKLYAAPKNTNTQLLWYRKDLVPTPPKTWDEMIQMSQQLKAQGKPYQIITMGAQYEGLVVLYNSLVASAGGRILNEEGTKAVFDEGSVRALQQLKDFATSGTTSPSFTVMQEDQARLEFESGAGAFQLNWPYIYPALQEANPELAAKVGWARYPGIDPGQPGRATVGGFNLAVSAYSRNPQEAFEAALCLRSPEHQKFSAINNGVAPVTATLYDDPDMQQAYPMWQTLQQQNADAASRPATPAYQNVSTVISAMLSPPAAIEPQRTADELRDAVQDALDSRGVLP